MFKAIKKILFIFCLLAAFFTVAHFALALDVGLDKAAGTGLVAADPRIIIANIIRIALGFLGVIAVCLIIYAGWLWMTAGGNEEKVEQAKATLRNAVIGLIIILSSFAIASFVLSRLQEATGGGGDGTCATTCAADMQCCFSVCISRDKICNPLPPPGDDSFGINSTVPRDEKLNVARNVEVKVFLNKDLADDTAAEALNENFLVQKTDTINPVNGALTPVTLQQVNGGVASTSRIISFKATGDGSDCGDERHTPNCLSAWSKYKVTVDGASGILSINGQHLDCAGTRCQFVFSTGNLIDTNGPQSGIVSTQMCKAETGILMKTDANTVTGWGRDDVGISELGFYQKRYGTVPDYLDANLPNPVPGLGETYQTADHKYETKDMTVGNKYDFSVYTYDVANHLASSSFSTIISPGHCCNGIRDMGETEIDCGRDAGCGACDGEACADNMTAPAATCNSNLCASQFCTTTLSNATDCGRAGYGNATSCCLCRRLPVITGVFPVGGFCVNNVNKACLADSDCPSSTCDKTKPNGVAGNFVTIVGRNFGERPSAISPSPSPSPSPDLSADSGVFFSGGRAGTWIEATLADGVGGNKLCANNVWSDEQIIAIVPTGAVLGPIKVVTKVGFSDDSTANPEIENFVVNSIARPGICQIENKKCLTGVPGVYVSGCKKDHGLLNDTINYYGIKLLADQAYFGDWLASTTALSSNFANQTSGTAVVPNITAGKTSTFVATSSGKVYSNYLNFYKDPEPYRGPMISSFDPIAGPAGQYVTIHGSGFGAVRGVDQDPNQSHVYFGGTIDGQGNVVGGTEASYIFPGVCADSIWSDKQVIVKVPPIVENLPGFVNGHYKINMKIGTWPAIDTTLIQPATFEASSTLPLKPGLCKIKPIIGKVNSQVSLYGEYFGVKDANSKVRFQLNKDQSGSGIGYWGVEGDADLATTTVHTQAVTGPVKAVKSINPELVGNGLNFTVGICEQAADCGSGNLCCSAGTPYAGQCKAGADTAENIQKLCFPEVKSCVYEWNFSTVSVPVAGEGEPCYEGGTAGSCDIINKDQCDKSLNLTCDPDSCKCLKPCNKNLLKGAVCAQDPTKCQPNETCNKNCLCESNIKSCAGYGNQCADTYFCPNSPGNCSLHPTGGTVETGSCDSSCNNFSACKPNLCEYNLTLKQCVRKSSSCALPRDITYTLGLDPAKFKGTASCLPYASAPSPLPSPSPSPAPYSGNRWIMTVNTSCPIRTTLRTTLWTSIGGNQCLEDGTDCLICDPGFKCLKETANATNGTCVIDQPVCLVAGSTCGNNICTKADDTGCECCCRKNNANQDCCAPLKCEGACGSETALDNGKFGLCTGCTVTVIVKKTDGTIDSLASQTASQTASNKVCNCVGTSGKYCDMGAASSKGVCKDCAQLSTGDSCSNKGVGTCCVDAMNNNACSDGRGAYNIGKFGSPNYAYCAYYECKSNGKCSNENLQGNENIAGTEKVASSTNPVFSEFAQCKDNCDSGVGDKCYDIAHPGPNCNREDSSCRTGLICDPTTCSCQAPESCSGYGNQCNNSYYCPNSPGKCSLYAGGLVDTEVKCDDGACKDLKICQGADGRNLCSYVNSTDKNVDNKCKKNGSTCGLSTILGDTIGNKDVPFKCGPVDGKNVWYYDSKQTCREGWVKSIDKTKCLGAGCVVCPDGFSCQKEGINGVCMTDTTICSADSTCQSGQCKKKEDPTCECCCEIDQNKDGRNPSCCSPLKCGGTCGAETGINNSKFGHCTGCTIKNERGNVSQYLSNDACNCLGSSGKYCDMAGDSNLGVCKDCAQLSDAEKCTNAGAGTCCVDAMKNNVCRGGEAPYGAGGPPVYNYCAYYKCNANDAGCNTAKIASSTAAVYSDTAKCTTACKPAPQLGQTCFNNATTTQSCDASKCGDPFACLTENGKGSPPTFPTSCGVCCCDPLDNKCLSPLKCQANKGNCSGANRGLCCGCSKDSDCGTPITIGCGNDTCCQVRPKVIDSQRNQPNDPKPKPASTGVCRNTLISATFDQAMQINTFAGNIIVVGEYGSGQCPTGTQYLTAVYKPTVFARIKSWLAGLPVINKLLTADFVVEAQAESSPSPSPSPQTLSKNYCAVQGSISGYNTVLNQITQTVMEFRLQKVLEAGKKYYVIIKGDSDLNDAVSNGVLNQAGIGMSPNDGFSVQTFNGVTYRGKIWSFTTKPSTAAGNGICQIDSVSINLPSYLFTTSVNNTGDDTDTTKDPETKDSDKIFYASAHSADGQLITSIANIYGWRWNWTIDNQAVVKFKTGGTTLQDVASSTLVAQNVKDDNTLLHAKATVNVDTVGSTVGTVKEAAAPIQVFLCANPWPPFKSDGSWDPWLENGLKCSDPGGSCSAANAAVNDLCGALGNTCITNCTEGAGITCSSATNYALYYCRDASQVGTADDLPAISSEKAVITGQSVNLKCSDGSGSCVGIAKDSTCSDGTGTCQIDILKELYFFREGLPDVAKMILVTTTNDEIRQGGKVGLIWPVEVPEVGQSLDKYQIYYGATSGHYTDSIATSTNGKVLTPQIISGLTNGRKYYFAVTAKYKSGGESAYSNEVTAIPADTLGPKPPPAPFTLTPRDKRVELTWPNNNYGEVVSYRVFYKANDINYTICDGSTNFGNSIPAKNNTATVSGLANGVKYCFGLVAYDSYGNSSATTTTQAIPFAPVTNLSLVSAINGTVKLSWGAAQGATGYNLYYGTAHGVYGAPINVENVTSYSKTGLANGTTYYFAVTSYNADRVESVKSNEISAKPLALATPQGLWSTADATGITIKWTASTTDASVSYKVYYGATSGSLDKSVSLVKSKCSNEACFIKISNSNFDITKTYYFSVAALDAQGNESPKASEISFDMTKITNQASIDLANCQVNLQQIKNVIIAKRIEKNTYLMDITHSPCSACACYAGFEKPECSNQMADVFKTLGFSGLLKDPWNNPYLINENEYEDYPSLPCSPCCQDNVYSSHCDSDPVPLFNCVK